MIGAIAMNEIKKYFGAEGRVVCNEDGNFENVSSGNTTSSIIDGYVKFNKIFIKTTDQGIKIEIFKKKQEILTRVNESLAKLGYATKMIEIMTK